MSDSLPRPLLPAELFAEVSRIITSSHDADETLARTAQMVAEQMQVDVCSIYSYDSQSGELLLKATFGLNPNTVGQVRMKSHEGLVGLVVEDAQPIQVAEMQSHPRFKSFPQTNEDAYLSFLGVPLIEHRVIFGVIVLHTVEARIFQEAEVGVLTMIASQISSLVSKALLIQKLDAQARTSVGPPFPEEDSQRFNGSSVAPGVAVGRAVVLQQHTLEEPPQRSDRSVEEEARLFADALDHALTDTLELANKVSGYVGPEESAIFHAHLMFLEDHAFQDKIQRFIQSGSTAAWAVYRTVEEYLLAFETIADSYLREKSADLKDVGYRLLNYLGHDLQSVTEKKGILVARQLLPGDIARLDPECVQGIVTSSGGVVSHSAILARSLLIPAICIPEEDLDRVHEGELLALDGHSGFVVRKPNPEVVDEFQKMLALQERHREHLATFRDLPCTTQDGTRIEILANVALESDTYLLEQFGAEGIGLYRTEIYFLSLDRYPEIPEQTEVYQRIIENVEPELPVIFRTLDVGADKAAPYMGFQHEENPFLGYRALRRQLRHPELLKAQIKALLLAAKGRPNVRLMFPMITELQELREARALLEECLGELQEQGERVQAPEVGMMFEVPAAVLTCDRFLPEVDFCSIGSNDLTQYVLAVDRNNTQTAYLYDPLSPAVLQLIRHLVEQCQRFEKPLELCGEMASDPDGCILLTGLGMRQLSMNPPLIPQVKDRLSQVSLEQAESLAQQALQQESAQAVRAMIAETIGAHSFAPKLV
jgi:phosphotransferase system enzyme I (PtsP)